MENMWSKGILGVVVGDALGCPVQFETRSEVAEHPITGMRGYGTFNLPAGSWTDDSSLTLALLDSINTEGKINLKKVADNFVKWLDDGEYTPYGYSYDIGGCTYEAITKYKRTGDFNRCGGNGESNNGNGSLMRIMPAVLYCIEKCMHDEMAIHIIHKVSALTHAHARAMIACGLYYFMAKEIVKNNDAPLIRVLQAGIKKGIAFYRKNYEDFNGALSHYYRLYNLSDFAIAPQEMIKSSGYVVDTLEAAVWSLINSSSYREALLTAVNLGYDTDTVGAVTGGLAGLYYGYIPQEWIDALQKKDIIEEMCLIADHKNDEEK